MREISAEIDIGAPPERVWSVLTDFVSYPDWNPFIRQISGDPAVGARLRVRIEPPGGRGMTFRPRVVVAEPSRELRWLGRLGAPGLFDGEHSLRLEPLDGARTRFVHSERFRGVLVPLFRQRVDPDAAWLRGLQHRAEGARRARADGLLERESAPRAPVRRRRS